MHPIQDFLITVGTLLFLVALIPTIIGKDKPALSTSFLTASVLLVFSGTFASLHLWFSAVTDIANAGGWLILGIQKYRLMR